MVERPALRIENVHKSFGQHPALHGVTFDVAEGEFVVLLGPSGSGKTTMLRIIAGFERPSSGEVFIREEPVAAIPASRRNIGVVFQHFALFPHLTVARNIAFGLEMRKRPSAEVGRRVNAALELVKLAGFGERMPAQLSGGQKQRVAIARALVIEPAVLLLDEPLGSLDANLRVEMQGELKRLQGELGVTTVMVTHDQEEAMTLADRVAIMRGGELQQIGRPPEVYQRPASAFVASFMGAANVLELTAARADGARVLATTAGGLSLRAVPDGSGANASSRAAIVRPEAVAIGPNAALRENVFEGKLVAATDVGPAVRCRIVLDNGSEIAATVSDSTARAGLVVGERIAIGFDAAAVHLVPQ